MLHAAGAVYDASVEAARGSLLVSLDRVRPWLVGLYCFGARPRA